MKDAPAEIQDSLSRLLAFAAVRGELPFTSVNIFECTAVAAFVKAVEFAILTWSHDEKGHPFFLTASLRGICEDTITLSWMLQLNADDRSSLAGLIAVMRTTESIATQATFFAAEKPDQLVLSPGHLTDVSAKLDAEAKALKAKYSWKGDGILPSVRQMALRAGLGDVYDYLYAATSRWVHFSPNHLLRMGWGPSNREGSSFYFSTGHFRPYYLQFNRVYGALLLVKQYRALQSILDPEHAATNAVDTLGAATRAIAAWPELVTFAEMNFAPATQAE